jgi:hypothetical protein
MPENGHLQELIYISLSKNTWCTVNVVLPGFQEVCGMVLIKYYSYHVQVHTCMQSRRPTPQIIKHGPSM